MQRIVGTHLHNLNKVPQEPTNLASQQQEQVSMILIYFRIWLESTHIIYLYPIIQL